MEASPISVGIAMGLGIIGLRGLWKLQHRLDLRGYLIQAAAFSGALFLAILGYYMEGWTGVVMFDTGVILMGAFLLVPDIVYYCLRFYDRR